MNSFKRKKTYKIILDKNIKYSDLTNILKSLSLENNYLDASDNQSIYRVKDKLDYRILVSNIKEFNKKEYDETKKNANKKFNKKFAIKNKESFINANLKMRLNIIIVSELNDELIKYLSVSSSLLLSRTEGIISFGIYNNTLIIPPLEGDLLIYDTYKKCIEFILNVIKK